MDDRCSTTMVNIYFLSMVVSWIMIAGLIYMIFRLQWWIRTLKEMKARLIAAAAELGIYLPNGGSENG